MPDFTQPPGGDAATGKPSFGYPEPGSLGLYNLTPETFQDLFRKRQLSLTQVYTTLQSMHKDLTEYAAKLPVTLPPYIEGQLLNPDGSPAEGLSVEAEEPKYTDAENVASITWAVPRDVTDERGTFRLQLPAVPVPASGLVLRLRGANAVVEYPLKRQKLLDTRLGILPLPSYLSPLAAAVVARLKKVKNAIASGLSDVLDNLEDFAAPPPGMTLGEGDCGHSFRSNTGVVDSFRYHVLMRLSEPLVNAVQPIMKMPAGEGKYVPMPLPDDTSELSLYRDVFNGIVQRMNAEGTLVLTDRRAIDRAIDVTAFRKQIEGQTGRTPKAASLGIGYILGFHQVWIPAGLSLGDLVYSLPLAPGEQQRIAIREITRTAQTSDTEALTAEETQNLRDSSDSSTQATYDSAFKDVAAGGSSIESNAFTASASASTGTGSLTSLVATGAVSSGLSTSVSSGASSSWQNTSRDFASSAAQNFHSALNRSASASRRLSRTEVRLATQTESEQITTKVISNNNHSHALTIQYWEVLRHFAISSEIDDVQMVCFVPMELISFSGQYQTQALSGGNTRQSLLARYEMLLRYSDVLRPLFAGHGEYLQGMRLLQEFATTPDAEPQPLNAPQQDTLTFTAKGTFLPNEELTVTVVGKNGMRIGPIRLSPATPNNLQLTQEVYSTTDDLLSALLSRRTSTMSGDMQIFSAPLTIPEELGRTGIARFELRRRFNGFYYRLKAGDYKPTSYSEALALQRAQTVYISPELLEQKVGGPWVTFISATLTGSPSNLVVGGYTPDAVAGPVLLLPAGRITPVLTYADLMKIEAVYQHVVRNTVPYSKAVWLSLTQEERAILLEPYTIGVPGNGITSPDQEVPLLNCAANQVLAVFGNCLVMPFSIPPQMAELLQLTSRDIQDALMRFHKQAFQQPRSAVTLPAKGMLGEAVLGSCNASEKIDLTRFWNWQDSPIEKAPDYKGSDFSATTPLITGSTGTQLPSNLISITSGSGSGGGSGSDLIAALAGKAPDSTVRDLTGIDKLQKQLEQDSKSAATGRDKVVEATKSLQETAMKEGTKIAEKALDTYAAVVTGQNPGKGKGADKGSEDKGSDDKGGDSEDKGDDSDDSSTDKGTDKGTTKKDGK